MYQIGRIPLIFLALATCLALTSCNQASETPSAETASTIRAESNTPDAPTVDTSEVIIHPDGYEEILVWSEGVRLVGRIYTPTDMQPGTKLPGLLLVNGWGGTVENTTSRYARIFADQGYVVLTQDFKGWGKSNGPLYLNTELPGGSESEEITVTVQHIRHVVDPISFLADTDAALDVLASDPRVQSKNIGVWGTSMGGGLSLITVAKNKNVAAFVDQIGAVNHKANFFMIPERTIREAEAGVARGQIPPYPDASSKAPNLSGHPNYIALKNFEPYDYIDDINVPTLIIDAQDEEFFDRLKNGKAFYDAIKDRVDAEYMLLPGKHYDIYREQSPKAIEAAIKWFNKYLKGE
ncbi:MAG: dienelactone hydrolase [Cryomorphaceae bacterium]|jgi:dienelactone hydrolase